MMSVDKSSGDSDNNFGDGSTCMFVAKAFWLAVSSVRHSRCVGPLLFLPDLVDSLLLSPPPSPAAPF